MVIMFTMSKQALELLLIKTKLMHKMQLYYVTIFIIHTNWDNH